MAKHPVVQLQSKLQTNLWSVLGKKKKDYVKPGPKMQKSISCVIYATKSHVADWL